MMNLFTVTRLSYRFVLPFPTEETRVKLAMELLSVSGTRCASMLENFMYSPPVSFEI